MSYVKYILLIGAALLCIAVTQSSELPTTTQYGLIIFIITATLWLTYVLPLTVTALLVPILAVLFGLFDVQTALSYFAHPIIFMFLGGFVLAASLHKYQLDQLFSHKMMAIAKGKPMLSCVLLWLTTALLSMWISNTAAAAIMLPLALGLLANINQHDEKLAAFILLGVAYSASIGGMATIIGSPPNAIAAATLDINFQTWFYHALPISLGLFVLAVITLILVFKPKIKHLSIKPQTLAIRWNWQRITVIVIFLATILCWMFSHIIQRWLQISGQFDSIIALSAIVLLVITKTISWNEIEKQTHWGILLLFGGGLTLSAVLGYSGAATWLVNQLLLGLPGLYVLVSIVLIILFIVFMTEVSSNTAVAAVFIPMSVVLANTFSLPSMELVMIITLSTSCAFMLPVATPPNAMVFSTRKFAYTDMLKAGFILNLVAVLFLASVYSLSKL